MKEVIKAFAIAVLVAVFLTTVITYLRDNYDIVKVKDDVQGYSQSHKDLLEELSK